MTTDELNWWETAVIYQIYPRSFQDSNDDGIGDLPGITTRLDYIANLGVDAIWISPFFKSPQKDFGYDVSDYCDVNPEYGTLADFDKLLAKAHDLNLKVMVDIVPAHCSDQHAWFIESRQSRDNEKADWFHWVEPMPDGTPPTNWLSFFGGPAWTWEPRRQQYYLHNFLTSQPNLNHANPAVREALMDVAHFWFDRGVDGFRLDAVHTINANSAPYENNLANPEFVPGDLPQQQQPFFRQLHDSAQLNQPVIQLFSESLREVSDHYGDRFLMGELHGDDPIKASQTFTAPGRLHATYNFNLLHWDGLNVDELKAAITQAIEAFNGTGRLSFAFSNHDVPRSATRQLARLGLRDDQQQALQLLLLKLETCLIGSSCIYQGEELALQDVQDIPVEQMQDPWGIEFAPVFLGRDTCRTPIVWKGDAPNGDFSRANSTWLPIDQRHLQRAALDEAARPASIYNQFSEFLQWRKDQPAIMQANTMSELTGEAKQIVFDRVSEQQRLRCLFDFETLTATFEEV
ncbi:alpha-glucosidase [Chromatiales bacterium (ex Bugula neritina AB1)]|nr:alpha-glucosidase [Chromatiales bacterium (ex Bugula neritina AB1)]